MLILEWVIIISASLAIVSVIVFLLFLLSLISSKKEHKEILKSKPKKRRSQRKWRKELSKIESQKAKKSKSLLLVFCILVLSASVGTYAKYYQMTNMTSVDTENIVSGYYLIDQVEQQLLLIAKEEIPEAQGSSNIHGLAVRMASFSAKKGSDRGSEEGQVLLNRYYARVGQFGVNLSSQQYSKLLESPTVIQEYIEDLVKIKAAQKNVLTFYKINESSLSEKK